MSYSRNEKALYLTVGIGTAIMIFIVATIYNDSATGKMVTVNVNGTTYLAIKEAPLYRAAHLEGYQFKLLSQQDRFGCEQLLIQVITPKREKAEFETCRVTGVSDPDREWQTRYEKDGFGYAWNDEEGQGYFIVRVSDHELSEVSEEEPESTDVALPRMRAPLTIKVLEEGFSEMRFVKFG